MYRNNLSKKMTKVYPWSWEVYPRSREVTKKIANLKRIGKKLYIKAYLSKESRNLSMGQAKEANSPSQILLYQIEEDEVELKVSIFREET